MRNLRSYTHLAARVFDTPLLIAQSKLDVILEVLGPRLGFDNGQVDATSEEGTGYQLPAVHLEMLQQVQAKKSDNGYFVVKGTAIIPVIGTLVQRGDWMRAASGMVSYDSIGSMFAAAMNDINVRDILFEFDTPGGEVAGAFDLADMIYNARGTKPIIAVANEQTASAGYLLASAADEVVVTRTGAVGSIGVVAAHYDVSRAMDKKGVAVTYVYAGDKKVDGNQFGPLPAAVKEEWQAEIDDIYQMFVDTVSRNMDIGADRVRGTQAGMYTGRKAVDAGLADRVNTFSNELSNLVLRQSGPYRSMRQQQKEQHMETAAQQAAQAEVTAKAEAEAKAKAEATAKAAAEATAKAAAEATAKAEAEAKAKSDSATAGSAERERVKAIVNHAEAKGRAALASHLAFETSMSVEEAGKLLAASAKEAKGALGAAMAGMSPGIRSQEDVGNEGKQPINTAGIYAKRKAAVEAAVAKK